MQSYRAAFPLCSLLALAACGNGDTPAAPVAAAAPLAIVRMNCSLEHATAQVRCATQTLRPSGDQRASGVRSDLLLPPEAAQLVLVFGADDTEMYDPATGLLSIYVAVRNTSDHPIGTPPYVTVPSSLGGGQGGVSVFYTALPYVLAGSGNVTVVEPRSSNVDTFTGPDQRYWTYDQILLPGQESVSRLWQWRISGDVQAWSFDLAIAALQSVPIPAGFVGTYDMDPTLCPAVTDACLLRVDRANRTAAYYLVDYHVTLNADYSWSANGLQIVKDLYTGERVGPFPYEAHSRLALVSAPSSPGDVVMILEGSGLVPWSGNAERASISPCGFCGTMIRRP